MTANKVLAVLPRWSRGQNAPANLGWGVNTRVEWESGEAYAAISLRVVDVARWPRFNVSPDRLLPEIYWALSPVESALVAKRGANSSNSSIDKVGEKSAMCNPSCHHATTLGSLIFSL